MTAEQSTASLSRIRKEWEAQGWGLFAVERQDRSALIGFCGLAPVACGARFSPKVEIGWRLAYDEWGQGFATEAASAVLDWVFGDLRWPEIVSFAREENTASRAVMTRLGMMRELSPTSTCPRRQEAKDVRGTSSTDFALSRGRVPEGSCTGGGR